ncbi:MAG: ACP S-malonyltransferase [Planctomycetota bacterium]|jgi:[acyl-carrier-protein] S-malonyltransferase
MSIAFIFPGQGAQDVGMGKDLAHAFPIAKDLFDRADNIVGLDLSRICFEGPAQQLNTTAVSQPAIFVVSAAILEVLRAEPAARQLQPDITAGLSLGEYTALYAAGLIDFEAALRLVQRRGQAMQQAAQDQQGAMVSIIGLNDEQVARLCQQAAQGDLLTPVNFNCPGQIVISGSQQACDRAEALAQKYGAIKAVPLDVNGAFHTRMMSTAADALSQALADCKIAEPAAVRVVANIDADYYQNADTVVQGLIKQLTSPILWQECMERLIADGVDTFYEIGPGRVLTSLMKRIDRKKKVVNVSTLMAVKRLLGS